MSLTSALTGTVLAMFHTLNGLNAGSALLVLMGAIKLLEATSRRDRLIMVGVSFYLLLAACLVSQDLLHAPLYLLHAWVCCTALLFAAHPDSPLPSPLAARTSARSLALALRWRCCCSSCFRDFPDRSGRWAPQGRRRPAFPTP